MITDFVLTPAGSRLDDAVVPPLVAAKQAGQEITNVIWDRGYSQLSAEGTTHPLRRAGMDATFRPKGDHQRLARPFNEHAVIVDGQLFSALMPESLWAELPMPPYGASEEECRAYEAAFNQRARWRYQRHAGPDADGVTRWRCPFHAGLLRSRALPHTMRRSQTTPLEELPDGTRCCEGTMSVAAAELPFWQKLPAGTTAWRKSYRRRNVVEGSNSGLKGGFVNIQQKFFRVFGLTKINVLLAFTIAGYNLEVIRSFNLSTAATEAWRRGRSARGPSAGSGPGGTSSAPVRHPRAQTHPPASRPRLQQLTTLL